MLFRSVEGYRNYDKSEFDKIGPLLDDDKELEKVWKTQYSLQAFLAPENFKTYEELKSKLAKVLSASDPIGRSKKAEDEEMPWADEAPAPKAKAKAAPTFESAKMGGVTEEDEDDDSLEFFKQLAG